jgi:glycosyltransferase involved in cell wall biosynthesis
MTKIIAFNKYQRHRRRADHVPEAGSASSVAGAAAARDTIGYPVADILVSVVVPTCNRPDLLRSCLASLLHQRFNVARFEIIVVDDAPSKRTHDVVTELAGNSARTPAVSYIANHGPHGPAAARNRGWRAARGTIIAFTDDDTIARPDWLQNGMRAFDADVQAVWGRIVMPLSQARQPTDYERDAMGLETAEFVTANCFCPKHVLEEIDGFDERFRYAWREDADLYFRLLGRHGRIVHAPAAVITHPIRPAAWGVSLKQQKKVLFDALLYKKHPRLYRQKIRSGPRWDYYLIVASLLVLAAGLVWDRPGMAAGAGLIWLFMTARFCAMRLAPTAKTPEHVTEMIITSVLIPPVAVFWRMVGAIRFRVGFF